VIDAALGRFSADFLTERLRLGGALSHGRVTAVHPGERQVTVLSTIVPLRLEYSADAPPGSPARLLLKASRHDLDASLKFVGQREVDFYRQVAPLMPDGPLVRCYDAQFDDDGFSLLLEDLSETHTILTQWPLPPSVAACEGIVESWAAFHGFWWRHPGLGRDVGTFADEAAIAKAAADVRERYARFEAALGDRLWPRARDIYARVLDAYERLYTPARLYATYTLVHGDAHVWNVLYPRDGVASGIKLIDWDAWRIGSGLSDLAYMMALHWYPERRARLERRLLERYHAALCAHGVAGYPLERLLDDYRFQVMGRLMTPLWQQTAGLHASIWWPHLNRIVTAFDDLDCAALLA
jgi:hypothetical protein